MGGGRIGVAVLDWRDDVSDVLIEAQIDSGSEGWSYVLMLAEICAVRRGLIDPMPDQALARTVCTEAPSVFALHAARGRSATALAEIAHDRMQTMERKPDESVTGLRVVDLSLSETGSVRVAVFVPEGEPVPTHVELVLGDAVVMEQPGGARMVEATTSLAEIRVVGEPDAPPVP